MVIISCRALPLVVFLVLVCAKHMNCIDLEEDIQPTSMPTSKLTLFPTRMPTISVFPSNTPTILPTINTETLSSAPSSAPTLSDEPLTPSSSPSNEPTSVPTNSELIPTSSPTSTPSTSPIIQKSSQPSFSASPTLFPTSHPSGAPTYLPTAPSTIPSSRPSTSPITSSPSTAPTIGTFSPFTENPTRTPSSSVPSSLPSSHPTCSPSFIPSAAPSPKPTLAPTEIPTLQPTQCPTSTPSSSPSFMPTPQPAMLGKTWWFLSNVDVTFHTTPNIVKYTHVQVQTAVQNAFSFVLADNLQDADRNKIYTLTQVYHPSDMNDPKHPSPSSTKDDDYYSSNVPDQKFHEDETPTKAISTQSNNMNNSTVLHYHVQSWCSSVSCMQSLRSTWAEIIANPLFIVEPLHEQGIRAIDNAQVLSIHTSITDIPPPIPPPLSPTRIVYIILGVILFVGTMFFLIKTSCKVWENKHILKRWCRSRWENLSLPCYLCCYELQRSWWNGFSLTSSSDEDNLDSGRDVGQLSVHYDHNHFSWQRSYLDDRDREASQKLRPSARDSEQEDDVALENGNIAMVPLSNRTAVVMSPLANRLNSQNHSDYAFSSEAYL